MLPEMSALYWKETIKVTMYVRDVTAVPRFWELSHRDGRLRDEIKRPIFLISNAHERIQQTRPQNRILPS